MLRLIAKRLLETIPVLLVVVTATFFMIRFVPGGPFTAEKAVTVEVKRNLEAHYGLNKPLHRQYFEFLGKLAHGDLGPSYRYSSRTVTEIIADKFPVSLELGAIALAVALVLGLSAGIVAALNKNTLWDYLASSFSMLGICVPTFVLGPLFVLVFAIHLQWVSASGWYTPGDRILPGITLGLVYAAYIARLTRGGMLEVLNQDYIRTARAKGAGTARIIFKHALRGGLLPVVAFLGPAAAGVLTGSFVIETIFQIPGLGREFIVSAASRDYTLVMGTVLLYAVILIGMNLLVDIVQLWLNPRLRSE